MATKDPEPKRIHAHDVFAVQRAATLLSYQPGARTPKEIGEAIKEAEAVFAKARKLKVAK